MTTLFTTIATVAIFALACAVIGLTFLLVMMMRSVNRKINECKRQIRIEQIDNQYKNRPTTAMYVKKTEGLI